MATNNAFRKFGRHASIPNMGIAIASIIMAVQFYLEHRNSHEAIIHPSILFSISAFVAIAGVYATGKDLGRFSWRRDGLPIPTFLIAFLMSGNPRPWVFMLLVPVSAAVLFLALYKHRGDYDEEDDRIVIPTWWR